MLGKCVGKRSSEFEPFEVVAICDHLCFFSFCQHKHEIRGKALFVAFHLFVESFGRHPIEIGQIGIQNYLLAPEG